MPVESPGIRLILPLGLSGRQHCLSGNETEAMRSPRSDGSVQGPTLQTEKRASVVVSTVNPV